MSNTQISSEFNFTFWVHLLIMIMAWIGPFLVYWPWMVGAYLIVQFQFFYFDRCIMNQAHGINDVASNDQDSLTFYAYLLESLGFRPDRKKLKFLARKVFNYCLIAFTLLWQVALGNTHLLKW